MLLDLATAKSILGLSPSNTAEDNWLSALIPGADAAVKQFCKTKLETQACVTEYYDGSMRPDQPLRYRPIRFYMMTGNLTQGSPIVSGLAALTTGLPQPGVPFAEPTESLLVDMPVCIQRTSARVPPLPTQTQILSVDNATQVTLTQNAIASVTGAALVFGIVCYQDSGGYGGQGNSPYQTNTQLYLGTDYMVMVDQPDGSSKQGVIRRIGGGVMGTITGWPFGWQYTGNSTLTARTMPTWQNWYGNLAVQYTAGWGTGPNAVQNPTSGSCANLPQDLVNATAQVVAWMRRAVPLGGQFVTGETLPEYSYSIGTIPIGSAPELGSARQILSGYREVSWGF